MDVVYATGTAVIGLPEGRHLTVMYGTHWPADDPVVRANPRLFSDDPKFGLFASVDPFQKKEPEPEPEPVPVKRGPGRPPKSAQ